MKSGKVILLSILLFTSLLFFTANTAFAEEPKWSGVDESVVEKYAEQQGRQALTPFINTDQGDLLLFVFLLAGTVGGFAAGYYWRVLTEHRIQTEEPRA